MKSNLIKHKEVLFIGSFLPNEIKEELSTQSIGLRSNANDLFQKNMIKGLLSNDCQVYQVSIPNIGSFPKRYKKILVPKLKTADTTSFRFINIAGIKQICHISSLSKYILLNKDYIRKLNLVIIYDLYSPFLLILPLLKYVHPEIVICVIVPDLPGFAGESLKSKLLSNIPKYIFQYTKRNVDYFSLIAPAMRDLLSIDIEKSIVIEGLYDPEITQSTIANEPADKKIILYSGSLDARNGISHLINAFENMQHQDVELHIYGDGPLKDYVSESSQKNRRIKYFGQVENSEVAQKYPTASLLVNPRLPTGIFTKYSFPSKTLEYLASGVPVIMYKLEGIPNDYIDYVIIPDELSSDCLAKTMDNCLISDYKFIAVAEKAKRFLLSEKTYTKQVSKILGFIFKQTGFEHVER